MTRNPDVALLLTEGAEQAAPENLPTSPPAQTTAPGEPSADCAPIAPAQAPPAGSESRHVLVIAYQEDHYPPTGYRPTDTIGNVDHSIYGRTSFTFKTPADVALWMLRESDGVDTVVLAQLCDIKRSLSETFKKALVAWVTRGHKLIIQDADNCGSNRAPDYGFLPYRFATSNPGAHGASGDRLIFVEENTIADAKPEDPAFLDIESWVAGTKGNHNELEDSNTITAYAPQWCGHLFGTNALQKNGFMEAYAHYGRGLLIYDGFDIDQQNTPVYRQLVTHELMHPFDPDNLPCSGRLGDFVIATEQRLKTQPMVPGRAYTYPLILLSNQGYRGTITLGLAVAPPDPTLTYTFVPDTVELSEISKSTLTVTTTAVSPPSDHSLTVRGTDTREQSNGLCLQLTERTTGGLQVVADFPRPKKSSKNLEIILDASGSMKLPLGKSTRIGTARQVLRSVLAKIPDDFNVGLRLYGHRYGSRQKETCTDTELLLPLQKLDRQRILSIVDNVKPRGETPLIYSVLQTPADLKPLGGDSVILITDGEESCHGDPQQAVRQLQGTGIDVTVNIVGFTLTGTQVEQQLSALAEATGGRYYSAQNGEALARALLIASIGKVPYAVFDTAGQQVAKGDTETAARELVPGEYRVVVNAGDQALVVEHVQVAAGQDTLLQVVLKADRFALEPKKEGQR